MWAVKPGWLELEAALFAAGEPLTVAQLAQALQRDEPWVAQALLAYQAVLEHEERGFRLLGTAGAYQLRTATAARAVVAAVAAQRVPRALSAAQMETLAVIAYHQPVDRATVDHIRGVHSDRSLAQLLEEELVQVVDHDAPGHTPRYGTTDGFLRRFALTGIDALPPLPQVEERLDEEA